MSALLRTPMTLAAFFFVSCTLPENLESREDAKVERIDLSPLLARVDNPPQAFFGSDKKYHVVYELILTNYSSDRIILSSVIIKDAKTQVEVKNLHGDELMNRFAIFGDKSAANNKALDAGRSGVIYLHLFFDTKEQVPKELAQEIDAKVVNASGEKAFQGTSDDVLVSHQEPAKIGPPLIAGSNYVAADGCCDSVRHVRAGLPINGKVQYAQRFAIDYEQIGDDYRIFKGPKEDLSSYYIYGKEAVAVAKAEVVSVLENLPDVPVGSFPKGITLETADGNSVVLKIDDKVYALYAHFQPGIVTVKVGDKVERGQVIGKVGNSGNTLAPHLHFQLMDTASPADSNGIPYIIDNYVVTGQVVSTASFDEAESKGVPVALKADVKPEEITNAYPMDQSIVSFP
jgi:murein DD-endopeptidase MepM/ murein hydrolase activator NlpD